MPVERLVPRAGGRRDPVLVDGAHAPGHAAPRDRRPRGELVRGQSATSGSAPRRAPPSSTSGGTARPGIRPLAISHGANDPRTDRSRFRLEFDWTGTVDPTAWLAAPVAIRLVGGPAAGRLAGGHGRNRALARYGRDALRTVLGPLGGPLAPVLAPDAMLGSMAVVELPYETGAAAALRSPLDRDALGTALLERFGLEVPIVAWPLDPGPGRPPRRLLRISAHLYNAEAEYAHLAGALRVLLAESTRDLPTGVGA